MNDNRSKKLHGGTAAHMILGSLAAFALLAVWIYAQEKAHDNREQINFSQIPTPVTPTRLLR